MKLIYIFTTLFFFFNPFILASDSLIYTYIPMANQETKLLDKNGIKIQMVHFNSYNNSVESLIESATWTHLIDSSPKYQGSEGNLAFLIGLKLSFHKTENNCIVVIDKSKASVQYNIKKINKITSSLEEATKLNLKNNNLKCEIKIIEAKKLNSLKKLNLKELTLKTFDFYKTRLSKIGLNTEELYPLGWSTDGKIAYISKFTRSNSNNVIMATFIKDSNTDKIIWKSRHGGSKGSHYIDIKDYWRRYHMEIEKQLDIYKIIKFEEPLLIMNKISYDNNIYSLSFDSKKYHIEEGNTDIVLYSKIYLNSNKKNKVLINEKDYERYPYLLERKLIGFLNLDKKNNKVAIVIAQLHARWNDVPYVVNYEIISVDLKPKVRKLADDKDSLHYVGLIKNKNYTMKYQLDLVSDDVYFLRTSYLNGNKFTNTQDDIGKWRIDSKSRLVLRGGREAPIFFYRINNKSIGLMNHKGKKFKNKENYKLNLSSTSSTIEPRLYMIGDYSYMADSAFFTEDITGIKFPVSLEKDNISLERGYLKNRTKTGQKVKVHLDASISYRDAMEGNNKIRKIIVNRFIKVIQE